MKITIYSVNDCQFSKAEKEYLQAHNQPFEEKNLETNKEFLTEMLTLSNNFAGTPVTKVEKDDGQIAILKGFAKEEFDKAMGYSQPKEAVVNSTVDVPPDQKPKETQPPAPPPTPPPSQPLSTTPQPEPPKQDEALNSVLDNLQSKAEPTAAPITPTPPSVANPPSTNPPAGGLPNIPEPDFK